MSEQNKIEDETKPKEEESGINTINENSNLNENTAPSTIIDPSHPQENQNEQQEQAELSEVETGKKDLPDFEEMINFTHTYLNYRITKSFPDRPALENSTFGLLMTNVFIYCCKKYKTKNKCI